MIIDVSHHNGKINWDSIKHNIDGAIIRIGYGDNIQAQDDKYFFNNVNACLENNIPFGFYLYSYADSMQHFESEMQHIMRLSEPYLNNMSLPIFYDLENPGTESFSNIAAEKFCEFMSNAGIRHGLYASEYWYNQYINLKDINAPYLWVAKYSENSPIIGTSYDLWQFTDKYYFGNYGPFDVNKVYNNKIFTDTNRDFVIGCKVTVIPDKIEGDKKYVVDTNGKYNRLYFDTYTVKELHGDTILLYHDEELFTRVLRKQVKIC